MCRSKRVEQLRNIGIINSTTRSHLVRYFYMICIMMHGSMNIKFLKSSMYRKVLCYHARSEVLSAVKRIICVFCDMILQVSATVYQSAGGHITKHWNLKGRCYISEYSHAPHNDISVNDRPHIQRWSRKIIINIMI